MKLGSWKIIVERHKVLRGQKISNMKGLSSSRDQGLAKVVETLSSPGVVAMVTYRGHVIGRRDPENLEASTIYGFSRKAVETGWKQRERQGQPRYVE